MSKCILVTGIGGPTPRSIAKRLRNQFPESKIIGADSNPKALGFYMNGLLDTGYIVPRADDDSYWDVLGEIVSDEKIDLAFVQPEKEVIAWGNYKKEHGTFICPVLIPPVEFANHLINKAAMAELLESTDFIPKTVRIDPGNPDFRIIEDVIGYPCWIRASEGSGGLGSLKLDRKEDLEAWLFIHRDIDEFTVSEFLTGRHLANQMLYLDGKLIRNAGLECAEYVMADIAPSKVTGNTSYGRLLNEDSLLDFCEEVMEYISARLAVEPHGVFSLDLKEDQDGQLKLTEINVRHMAYTGVMAEVGFDLISDSVEYLLNGNRKYADVRFYYDEDYIFLRDVDIEPIVMKESDLLRVDSPEH